MIRSASALWIVCTVWGHLAHAATMPVFVDLAVPQHRFAAQELKAALARGGVTAVLTSLAGLPKAGATAKLVIADASHPAVRRALGATSFGPQGYALKTTRSGKPRTCWAVGGDPVGTMYAGLDLAEHIDQLLAGKSLDRVATPHIRQRGIKLNIPLDARTPSYSDDSDSAQANIAEMWSMTFWTSFLDEMARDRFNALSLWSLNPWPSMVKVAEHPETSLADVKKKAGALWDGTLTGNAMYDASWPLTTVKTMTIDEKIAFWKAVMQMAADRGIDVYVITWNIFTYGLEGAGITKNDRGYWRSAVRSMFTTYPLLRGIGLTAGENMQGEKEQWVWDTYGQGFADARRLMPQRKMQLIHRAHQTDLATVTPLFEKLPGYDDADSTLAFSFKYSQAHAHSSTHPRFIDKWLGTLPDGKKTWLTVRDDDMYFMRWGDPAFVRAYIQQMPTASKLAGFFLGPDGYTWGREFLSKEPDSPRQLVIEKKGVELAMWGKLAYDPTLPDSEFQHALAVRFPSVSSAALHDGLAAVSRIVPLVNRLYWGAMDFQWYPEACWSSVGFVKVTDFVTPKYKPMGANDGDAPGILSVKQSVAGPADGKLTAMDVAALLRKHADQGTAAIAALKPGNDKELRYTLGDIQAMAHLGRYYAEKILGAVELARKDRPAAVVHLKAAADHWRNYATQLTSQYVSGQVLTRMGLVPVDFNAIQAAVDAEVAQTSVAIGPVAP